MKQALLLHTFSFDIWVMIVLFSFNHSVIMLVNTSFAEDDYQRCEIAVNNWATSQLSQEVKEDKHTLRDLLFFLHIPRTGGRTYFHW